MITLFKKKTEEANACEMESEKLKGKVGLGGARSKLNIPKLWRKVKFLFGLFKTADVMIIVLYTEVKSSSTTYCKL